MREVTSVVVGDGRVYASLWRGYANTTVGLQTPGEIVDANFGQKPFEFDIEDLIQELRASTKAAIFSFPLPEDQGDWTVILHK